MHRITLSIVLLLSATALDAASYQKTDGTIVDPIQDRWSTDHYYSGYNLEPNADLTNADLTNAVLWQADLEGADLTNAVLWQADLEGAYLNYADLYYADLTHAELSNANLTHADLYNADLDGADLRYADLTGADLSGANLYDADLRYADLTGADLSGSDFRNVYSWYDATWTDAFYYTNNEPTWRSGMDAAWRTSVGILALAPTNAVPEPSTLLLALIGLALLPRRRRR